MVAPDPWAEREPLVSVRIPTWKGHELLVHRAIPSVLNGLYRNLEVVVCSDGPDPDARAAVLGVGDPRVRYLELPERPLYPEHRWSFWRTAGTRAVNHALDGCRGAFIAPLDHDDAFTDDHIPRLLAVARNAQADMVHAQAMMERPAGSWDVLGRAPLTEGYVTHGSVLYSSRLAAQRMDPDCWLLDEPADWNMWRRMRELGASIAFDPHVVLIHFGERTSIGTERKQPIPEELSPAPEVLLADLGRTGLRWMLDVRLPVAVAAAA